MFILSYEQVVRIFSYLCRWQTVALKLKCVKHKGATSGIEKQGDWHHQTEKAETMKNNIRIIIYVFCIVTITACLPPTAAAQPEMIVEHYTKENGLPNDIVYSSLKDSDGFLWFGTWHGLCSFDGAKFSMFLSKTNPRSDVPPRKVRNMTEDNNGFLWIRNTDNRLYMFDKRTETFHDIYTELKRLSRNVQVIKIQSMDNGHVAVLTRNKNLYEVYADKNGKVKVNKIFDARKHTDAATMRLKSNVLGETPEFVYWISTKLNIGIVCKKGKARLLGGIRNGSRITCFNKVGKYLCAGTRNGDVFIVDTAKDKTYRYKLPENGSGVSSINIIGGKIYATDGPHLWTFAKGQKPRQAKEISRNVETTFVDKSNNLWMCSSTKTLTCYNTGNGNSQEFALPSDSLFAEMKFKDGGDGGLFILLRNGEVWRYDHLTRMMQNINRMEGFDTSKAEPHFFDIDVDSKGILWLSSTGDGVFKISFPHNNFKFLLPQILSTPDIENDNSGIRAVYQARNGDIWIGTRNGNTYCVDAKTRNVKKRFGQSRIGTVYNIMEDRQGNYWFSTKGQGLVKAVPDAMSPQGFRFTRYVNKRGDRNSISSNRVYNTYQDSRGRIWVCTFYGGLNLMTQRGGKVIFMHKNNGFRSYPKYELYTDVRAVAEDKDGRIWVGTTDGLMSFDGKAGNPQDIKFETYKERSGSGVIGNDIYSMYKDHNGGIWMGIFGSGLNKIEYYDSRNRKPVLKSYSINEKHGGDVITSITEDKDKCLWICTENGLASLSKGSAFVKCYDRFSGFPKVTIEDNTSACLKDGTMLIGCRQGLIAFNPEVVKHENEGVFNTFIVDFRVANRELWDFNPPILEGSLRYAERIRLAHNQNTFTIEFAAPHYTDNASVPYTYILDGFEEQWHENGSSRMASYANVPPGKYKFRVKVNDGKSPERVIEIVISPPWWASWWAYILYALMLAFALYGIMRMVIYTIRMRNEVYINSRLAELKIRFFTNVSHELRTPLTLIKGPIEELKDSEKLTASGREYLDLIDRNARKMLQLVNQILDFRKLQNGKMKMHVSYADINGIIENIMQEFHVMATERNIAFIFEKPDERIMAWCDKEKIGVVLNNLINNAFKYTREGGRICVALEQGNEGKACTIRVEDDGVGIPKSQIELIFERFQQASNKKPDDPSYAGTGIGLSLSKEYVNMHHGRIWAENLSGGKGVAFIVTLPTERDNFSDEDVEVYFDDSTAMSGIQPENESHKNAADNDDEHNEREEQKDAPTVMLIEDNVDMCRMLQLQLSGSYNVISAYNGKDGMEKIYRYHPDIIVTDLMMPEMGGMEVLESVRQDFTISHIPIIILTAKNTEEDRINAARNGANAFIAKPFSSGYLMARINQLLEEQRIFQRKMVVQSTVENGSGESPEDSYEQHLVKKDIEFVHKIHEIIEENLNSDDFNIDTIAGTIGLSRSAFFKKLKSLTGFAPVDLVREIRLTKAAKRIETTDDSFTEIAYSVGFKDSGYFGKCFRKKYGMTPKEYRAKVRQ